MCSEFLLQERSADSRLRGHKKGGLVDCEHLPHPSKVEGNVRVRGFHDLEAADNARSPAIGDHTDLSLRAEFEDSPDLPVRFREQHEVGGRRDGAEPEAHEVSV